MRPVGADQWPHSPAGPSRPQRPCPHLLALGLQSGYNPQPEGPSSGGTRSRMMRSDITGQRPLPGATK